MIRIIIIAILLVIFFIASLPIFLIEWILGKFNLNARHRSSRAIVDWAFRVCLFVSGVKIKVSGKENIPQDTPCLFVGNHNGFFDVLVSYVTIGKVMGFVSKKEVKKVPFLNIWMYFVNCIWLDRENIREGLKTILKGVELLKSGVSMFIFPEGTRSKDGKMLPFKEGSLKMAEKAGCPVVPVAMTHTADIFENQFPKIKPGTVTIQFGKPIIISELDKENKKFPGAYTQKIIQEMLDNELANDRT